VTECDATREHLLDVIRNQSPELERTRVEHHLQTCQECDRVFEREWTLDQVLGARTIYAFPDRLRVQLAARIAPPKAKPPLYRAAVRFAPGLVTALLAWLVLVAHGPAKQELVGEAINDHLRVLYAERPIEIESGGIHQVKPWFAGRLDFAPELSFTGDDEFPLQGGAIGLFLDRKAATFVFKRRLHTITLFVFQSDGLGWPLYGNASLGSLPATTAHARGFNTVLWREGDLGYALVSDLDAKELDQLAHKISAR
jgi:anti-sigma factor RsiW